MPIPVPDVRENVQGCVISRWEAGAGLPEFRKHPGRSFQWWTTPRGYASGRNSTAWHRLLSRAGGPEDPRSGSGDRANTGPHGGPGRSGARGSCGRADESGGLQASGDRRSGGTLVGAARGGVRCPQPVRTVGSWTSHPKRGVFAARSADGMSASWDGEGDYHGLDGLSPVRVRVRECGFTSWRSGRVRLRTLRDTGGLRGSCPAVRS